jgi:hypothetical protein
MSNEKTIHQEVKMRLHHPACIALRGGPTDHEGMCAGEAYVSEKGDDGYAVVINGPDDVICVCHERDHAVGIAAMWNAYPHLFTACKAVLAAVTISPLSATREAAEARSKAIELARAAVDKADEGRSYARW